MNLSNPQFIYDRARSDNAGLVTKRVDGSNVYVSGIESLENTGISATQTTDASQILIEEATGVLRTLLDGEALKPTWMTLPQSVLGADSLTAQYTVTMRFQVLVSSSANPHLISNRNDNVASFALNSHVLSNDTRYRVLIGENFEWTLVHPLTTWITATLAVNRDGDQARLLFRDDALRENTGLALGDRYQQNRIFGLNNSNNKQMLFSHVGIWNSYPTLQELEDLHAWVQDEMPLGRTLTITKDGSSELVPQGTRVHHMYADDMEGRNEVLLEELETDVNGEIVIDEDLLPAGKVRFIRTVYEDTVDGETVDVLKSQFFTD